MKNINEYTLAQIIRKEITLRIVVAILLIILFGITLSAYDVYNSLKIIQGRADTTSENAANFIASQLLVNNEGAITTYVNEFNQLNKSITLKWIKNSSLVSTHKKFIVSPYLKWSYFFPIHVQSMNFGLLMIQGSMLHNQPMLYLFLNRIVFIILFSIFLIIFLTPISKKIPKDLFVDPVNTMLSIIRNKDSNNIGCSKQYPKEINHLMNDIKILIDNLHKEIKHKEILRISMQLAHDIRSPLAAINIALTDIKSLPDDKRLLIKNAAERINAIASNVLSQSRTETDRNLENNTNTELLSIILHEIISEKEFEYQNSQIKFNLTFTGESNHSFAKINLYMFKRIISNVINNSVEALFLGGEITTIVFEKDDKIFINICDNGHGVPISILPKVFKENFSYNKSNGTGLGLFYAKKTIEEWGGNIKLSSEINKGTNVLINLPVVKTPDWFCKQIELKEESVIVILDDDCTIHEAWKQRFKLIPNIKIHYFESFNQLSYFKMKDFKTDLFLVDFELFKDNKNGVDIIEDWDVQFNPILVTSHYDDLFLRARCQKLGIKILPKAFIQYIEIIII